MFDKIRKKAKQIFEQDIRQSSNSGRIHTVAVVTEVLLFGAIIFTSRSRKTDTHVPAIRSIEPIPTIKIGTLNIFYNPKDEEDEEDEDDGI